MVKNFAVIRESQIGGRGRAGAALVGDRRKDMGRWDLRGSRCVVTGGTKGLGLAIVKEFLELGASVLFTLVVRKRLMHTRRAGCNSWPGARAYNCC